MSPDYRDYINKHPRYTESMQQLGMPSRGTPYIEDRSGKVIDRLIESVRKGSIVRVLRPFLLAPIKGRPKTRRAKWAERVERIRKHGGKVIAVQVPGLSGAKLAMLAYEEIANSGRGQGPGKTGRPKILYTPEQLTIMRCEWHSKKHKTRKAAHKAILAYGIKVTRGYLYAHYPVND